LCPEKIRKTETEEEHFFASVSKATVEHRRLSEWRRPGN
jgi:hypothetical protein